jgi:hypothetical protein
MITEEERSEKDFQPSIVDAHNEEIQETEVAEVDYASFDKADFAKLLKDLSQDGNVQNADRVSRQVRSFIDEIREKEKQEALSRFLENGGKQEDFEMRADDHDLMIDGSYKVIRDKKTRLNRDQEEQRQSNLAKKEVILVRLREVVEREDAAGSFQDFKKLQDEWRTVGAVPVAYVKPLWASYHALVDRFFDNRNIYFELLELDRRKNLETKIELCAKAEKLLQLDSLNDALREINELHNEWRHIGPVPKDEKDAVWSRFKAASDFIYQRRDIHVRELSGKLKQNLKEKQELIARLEPLVVLESKMIRDWNSRSQEILEIQKLWTGIGPVERSKTKDINKKFWQLFKGFFNRKGQFFKAMDAERQSNLEKKRALVARAIELKEQENFEQTAEQIKQLQKDWKEIGPVPEKFRVKIYDEFRAACDHFFNRRREIHEQNDKAQEENLKIKLDICEQLSALKGADAVDQFKSLVAQFGAAGHVPRNKMNQVRARFDEAIATFTASIPETDGLRDRLVLEVNLAGMKGDPDSGKRIYQQEQQLRKKIQQTENDLAVLKNNLEFFARSKNADQVRADFQVKIDQAAAEVARLKSQLKVLRAATAAS